MTSRLSDLLSHLRPANLPRAMALATLFFATLWVTGSPVVGCPFCKSIQPTLTQQRESAQFVLLGELRQKKEGNCSFLIHQSLGGISGDPGAKSLDLKSTIEIKPGMLAVLFGNGKSKNLKSLTWRVIPINEIGILYFMRAPKLRDSAKQRLAYFAKYLGHREPLLAEDAYMEFAHASYEDIAAVADKLPQEKFRQWIVDPDTPGERKGFFGLALGLAKAEKEKQANIRVLEKLIEARADDFRSGFDGVLAGYLIARGEKGLAKIESRYLIPQDAAHGDVRHAASALRFFFQYGRDIQAGRLREAMRHLLKRPEFAEQAIIDLARWEDWKIVDRVARLYDQKNYPQPAIRRAVVGYLLACGNKTSQAALAELRRRDAPGVAEAEQYADLLGTLGE